MKRMLRICESIKAIHVQVDEQVNETSRENRTRDGAKDRRSPEGLDSILLTGAFKEHPLKI